MWHCIHIFKHSGYCAHNFLTGTFWSSTLLFKSFLFSQWKAVFAYLWSDIHSKDCGLLQHSFISDKWYTTEVNTLINVQSLCVYTRELPTTNVYSINPRFPHACYASCISSFTVLPSNSERLKLISSYIMYSTSFLPTSHRYKFSSWHSSPITHNIQLQL